MFGFSLIWWDVWRVALKDFPALAFLKLTLSGSCCESVAIHDTVSVRHCYVAQMPGMIIILEAGRQERHYWADLWRYRELFQVLAWRDLSVRYRQTVIGALWAIIRPFLTMVVLTVIFSRLAKLPSEGAAPYPLM
jgi:hypothetical protein